MVIIYMKILFINDMYTVGGATKALIELVLKLRQEGHEPIVCTSTHDSFNDLLDTYGVQNIADGHISVMDVLPDRIRDSIIEFKKMQLRYLKARYRAVKIIENSVDMRIVDLIHTNSIRNDIGCILCKKYGIPHIMHVREFGQEDFSCSVYMPNYYRYINHRCDILLAVSNAVRKSVIAKGIVPHKIRTLYDGVDFCDFVVKDNNIPDNEMLKMVLVGGICEAKGQHIAVKALSYLPENIRNNVTLDLVGWDDPVFLSRINKMISALNLEDHVRILGARDDIAGLLCNYNIGLMCSKSEGFGRVTAEYMYVGLGVIAADTGASSELVKDGVTGLIYHRNNPEDLAKKIEVFYKNSDLLNNCSRNAHAVAKKNFSSQMNYEKILKVYYRLLLRRK